MACGLSQPVPSLRPEDLARDQSRKIKIVKHRRDKQVVK
jgi:hypothetical protein